MDELAFRVLTGRASPEEEAALIAWRDRSPANAESYRALERALSAAAAADAHRTALPPPRAEDLLAERERDRTRGPSPLADSTPFPSRLLRGIRPASLLPWAAALLLSIGLSSPWRDRPTDTGSGVREVVTGSAETATVVLQEGTVVRLAPESRLRMNGAEDERAVSLTGRGYFAVAKNPDLPFRIHTAAGEVEVLGTRFDLDATNADLRVTVVEGTVVLSVDSSHERLEAGQVGRVVRGTLLPPETVEDPTANIEWIGKFLAFQSTPLRHVIPEIERIYGVDVRIDDPALAERTVTIHFADWSIEEVVESLCVIVQARCAIDRDVIRITNPANAVSPA